MFLSKSARRTAIPILIAAVLITSCNFGATPAPTTDVNALSTALVGTTVAQLGSQLTQTALAAPTNTPESTESVALVATLPLPTLDTSGAATATLDVSALPTFSFDSTSAPTAATVLDTPASSAPTAVTLPSSTPAGGGSGALGDACDNLQYLYDVTVPDGSTLKGGETITKLWDVKNTGNCTWDDGYALIVVGGDPAVGAANFKFQKSVDFVPGGSEKVIGAPFTAPCAPGKYSVTWRMRNDRGYYFGSYLSAYFVVGTTKVGGC